MVEFNACRECGTGQGRHLQSCPNHLNQPYTGPNSAPVMNPATPATAGTTGSATKFEYDTWAKRARDKTINETTDGDNAAPPIHYDTSVQPIDLIEAGEAAGMIGFREGQIIKYVFRWRKRGGLRDLKAAAWFLNRMIAQEEAREQKSS